MTTKNDITGDEIKTKIISESYRENFEKIFGTTKNEYAKQEEQPTKEKEEQ